MIIYTQTGKYSAISIQAVLHNMTHFKTRVFDTAFYEKLYANNNFLLLWHQSNTTKVYNVALGLTYW